MANQIFEEKFVGKYDGVTPATLLPHGALVDGRNMRKVSPLGGWKTRKGSIFNNTTAAESSVAIKSLHRYENPRSLDYHFLAQCNSKLLDATNDPPAAGTTFGSTLGVTVGTTPGFSCLVKEDFFYADGSGRPVTYGGDTPYATGFLTYEGIGAAYIDETRVVTDGRTTVATIFAGPDGVFYVGSNEIADGIVLDLTAVNTWTGVSKVYSWVAGAWSERTTAYSDGTLDTATSSITLAKDGTMSWTRNTTDTMHVLGGIMAYWYKVAPQEVVSAGTLINEDCSVITDWADSDAGDGASTQATYDGQETMKLDSGSGAGNDAERTRDFGTTGDKVIVETKLYHLALGTEGNTDYLNLRIRASDVILSARFCTDGLMIHDGSSYVEVGTDIVGTGAWNVWTFVLDFTTAATASVDIYKDAVLQEAGVDCSSLGTFTDGEILLTQKGETTSNRITYVDYVNVVLDHSVVTANKCQVTRDATSITNKWNGVYEYVGGCRFFDQSSGEYDEALGKISNESTSQYIDISAGQTADYLYFKTFEPATGLALGVVVDYTNTDDAQVDLVEHWDGNAWTTCGTVADTTLDTAADSSFGQTGVISWNGAALSPKKRTFEGDQIPGYWYRVSWDVALSAGVRIYLALYIPFPEVLPSYDGCVEFKGRLFTWGDPEYPNRLRYSAYGAPDCFSGSDSGWSDQFGGMDKVLCALPFYNELIVFKEKSVWLLEGYSPQTFGALRVADTVGLASPQSAKVVEVGSPGMHEDEPMSIAIWQDVDGIYVLDGRKPRKVSVPVDQFFNTEYATAIPATSIRDRQAFVDPLNNEYHLLLPGDELVYNYATDEWYPPWKRAIDLVCGLNLRGTDDRIYTYGGTGGGQVLRLENDTTDKTAANVDVVIVHSIKTRAVGIPTTSKTDKALSIPVDFTLRRIWAKLKARSTGDIITKTFKDMEGFGETQTTPQAMSLGDTINFEENCSVLADPPWTDGDAVNGTTTQTAYDSRDCFKFDSGAQASGSIAGISRDLGTLDDKVSIEFRMYHSALGTLAALDYFEFYLLHASVYLSLKFASDGLFIHNGTADTEVGTNIVSTGAWTDWKFEADCSIPANATMNVYKNGVLQSSGVNCARTGAYASGSILIRQRGYTTANQITYLDSLTVRSGPTIVTPGLDLSEERCANFQVEFSSGTADQEMEIWSMPYEVESRSLLAVQ